MATIAIELDSEPLPEVEEHQQVEFVLPAAPDAALELRVDGELLEPFLRPGEQRWRWRWDPGAAVGAHRLLLSGSDARRALALRVLPRKLDRDRYELLLEDLRRSAHELVLALGGGFEEGGPGASADRPRDLLVWYYALFEERLDRFERAVRRIAARPREQLRGNAEETPITQAATLDPSRPPTDLIPAPPGVIAPIPAGALGAVLPEHTTQRRTSPTRDTYEHRLLRRTLSLLERRAAQLGEAARSEAERLGAGPRAALAGRIADGSADARRRLRDMLALPLLEGVGELSSYRGPTPLLQREPPYREILRMWRALRGAPQIQLDAPLFQIPIAELPRLYEIWCALRAALALLGCGGSAQAQELVADLEGEPRIAIAAGALLSIQLGGWQVTLRYQPRYRPGSGDRLASLDRHTRVPDLAFEARGPNNALRVLLLDAKYRLDAESRRAPQDALAEAYAYHGAVGRAGRPLADAALILYPGDGDPERYPGGAGALPLLPDGPDHLAETLQAWCASLEP